MSGIKGVPRKSHKLPYWSGEVFEENATTLLKQLAQVLGNRFPTGKKKNITVAVGDPMISDKTKYISQLGNESISQPGKLGTSSTQNLLLGWEGISVESLPGGYRFQPSPSSLVGKFTCRTSLLISQKPTPRVHFPQKTLEM